MFVTCDAFTILYCLNIKYIHGYKRKIIIANLCSFFLQLILPILKYVKGEHLSPDHWLDLFRILGLPRGTSLGSLMFGDLLKVADVIVEKAAELKVWIIFWYKQNYLKKFLDNISSFHLKQGMPQSYWLSLIKKLLSQFFLYKERNNNFQYVVLIHCSWHWNFITRL